MENRGLMTADDRAFFRGEKDVDDEDKVAREKRYNIRRRLEKISDDLEILREAGEDSVVEDFYEETGRYERLEKKVKSLERELDDS